MADASGLTQFEAEVSSASAELRRLRDAHADITGNMLKLVGRQVLEQTASGSWELLGAAAFRSLKYAWHAPVNSADSERTGLTLEHRLCRRSCWKASGKHMKQHFARAPSMCR